MLKLKPVAAGLLVAFAAIATAPMAWAQADDVMARLNAEAMELDPADYPFVQAVCTVCHSPEMFLRNRSWQEWQGIYHDMISYGARGTQEQWDHIYAYFLKTLTVVNVNKALEDELMGALQVDEKTAITIIQRRPFRSLADLKAIPGIKASVIDALQDGARIEL